MRGTVDVAKFLMSLGAQPYARNNQELVPYEVAVREDVRPYFAVCPVSFKPGVIACSHCHVIMYADVDCQKKDYYNHKKICQIFQRRKTKKSTVSSPKNQPQTM